MLFLLCLFSAFFSIDFYQFRAPSSVERLGVFPAIPTFTTLSADSAGPSSLAPFNGPSTWRHQGRYLEIFRWPNKQKVGKKWWVDLSHVGLGWITSKKWLKWWFDLFCHVWPGMFSLPLVFGQSITFFKWLFPRRVQHTTHWPRKRITWGGHGGHKKKTTTKFRKSIPNIWCYLDEWWMIEIIKLFCLGCCMA